jgi:phosphatidylglycerol:prolipoprotein diacylglycerol transferase
VYPVVFEITPFGKPIALYSYGVMIVAAFLVASFHARRRAHRSLALDKERVFNVCFAVLFIGLLGARVLHVLVHYGEYTKEPLSFLKIWDGGLSFLGGLVGGLLWLAWFLPRHLDLKGFGLVDVLVTSGTLAIFVGGFGMLLSGYAYGKPAPDLAWGITFPQIDTTAARPRGEPLHPTQVYLSLHGILMFAILVLYARKAPISGRTTGLFLVLYAVGRAAIEIWRGDDAQRGMVIDGVLSVPQLLCVPLLFAGLAIWLIRRPADAPIPLQPDRGARARGTP